MTEVILGTKLSLAADAEAGRKASAVIALVHVHASIYRKCNTNTNTLSSISKDAKCTSTSSLQLGKLGNLGIGPHSEKSVCLSLKVEKKNLKRHISTTPKENLVADYPD